MTRSPEEYETKALIRFQNLMRIEDNGCHTWIGKLSNGYGHFYYQGRNYAAHRFAWFLKHGEWPPPWPASGLVLHHKCHNQACVNADHLDLITHQENLSIKSPVDRRTRETRPPKNQHCVCCRKYIFDEELLRYEHRDWSTNESIMQEEIDSLTLKLAQTKEILQRLADI